jgi:hypothetical protein
MKIYEGERGMDGVKVTVNGTRWPAGMISGPSRARALNGALLVRVHSS